MDDIPITRYVSLIEDCTAIETNSLNMPISYFLLKEEEIFKIHGYYNYYGEPGDLWNTEHPVIEISFHDMQGFKVYYEIPPLTYQIINCSPAVEKELDVTIFWEVDLAEREESLETNHFDRIKDADKIIHSYQTLSALIEKNRKPEFQWPNTYALPRPLD